MSEDQVTLDANARWLRGQREFFDISTIKLAEKARAVARQLGDEIKLSQQLISKFENGGMKTTSRWLGYVQIVFLQMYRETGLHEDDIWDLRLPEALDRFFEGQRKRLKLNNPFAELQGKEDYSTPGYEQPMRDEERELVSAVRKLPPDEFELLANLARVLARAAVARDIAKARDQAVQTLHDRQMRFNAG